MKQLNWLATAATALVLALGLVACGKTKNNSDNASTPASVCTRSWDGTMRDQYGRNCGNYATNSCLNTSYNPATGQYVDISTGAPVNCASAYNGTGAIPYYGQYGGQQISGCQGWSQLYSQYFGYPVYYIPVDLGNGQLICMNSQNLYQQAPQYNWQQYYYTQVPIYTCSGYDCGGGYYGGYQYSCNASLNLGFNFGGGSIGGGLCLY